MMINELEPGDMFEFDNMKMAPCVFLGSWRDSGGRSMFAYFITSYGPWAISWGGHLVRVLSRSQEALG